MPELTDQNIADTLRQSDALYHLLADYGTEVVARQTPGGVYLYVSPACRALLGYDPATLIEQSAYDFCHPADVSAMQTSHLALTTGADCSTVEYRIRTNDGAYIWVETTNHPVRDDVGTITEIVTVSRDIGKRKQIEAACRESQEKFQALAQSTTAGILIHQGRQLIYANPAVTTMTGYSQAELLRMNIWDLVHPDYREIVRDRATARLQGQQPPSQYEFKFLKKSGDIGWVHLTTGLIEYEGQPAVLATVFDITGHKQASGELRQSEEKWRSLVENAPDFIFIINRDHTIQFVNHTVSGLPIVEILGTDISHYVPPDYQEVVRNRLERAFQTGEPDNFETVGPGPDGTQVWYQTRIGPIKDRTQVTALILVSTEITERKRVEEALAYARDQALEASRLKSDLLAKVSHELRTPLNAILGFTELMDVGLYGPLTAKQQQAVTQVIDSTAYLTTLVNELLDQARLDAGRVKLNPTSIRLKRLLEQTRIKMGVLAEAKGLRLTMRIEGLPDVIRCDRERVQQILFNLIGNAIKFTEQGEVDVLFYSPGPTQWAIRVSDTGVGIPEPEQARIFEPFQQVDSSLTRNYRGSGLGLSIVNQLTNLMGGSITVESEFGQGSLFTVRLPLHKTMETHDAQDTPGSNHRG